MMMINKYIKTKIKIYASGMITNFQSKKMPKEKAPWKCLPIIIVDLLWKQILLSKVISWKTLRRIQIWRRKDKNGEFIDDDIEKGSSDEFDNEYGKENDECNE